MDTTHAETKKSYKNWYAWVIAAAGFLMQFCVIFALQANGMTISYVAEGLNVATTDLAIVASVFGLTYGGCGVIWGSLSDRTGLRGTLTVCAIGVALSMIAYGLFTVNIPTAILWYALAGAFAAGLSYAVTPKLIATWFAPSWTGKAFIVVTVGGTGAGIAIGIIAPQLLMAFGWRGTWIGLGICVLVFAAILFLGVKNDPKSMGLLPFGATSEEDVETIEKRDLTKEEKEEKRKESKERIIRVLKLPITWQMGLIWIVYQSAAYSNSTYFVATLTGVGWSVALAGLAFSTMRTAQTGANVFWPFMSDLFARKYVIAILAVLAAGVFLVMNFLIGDPSSAIGGEASVYVLAVMFGLCFGFIPVLSSQNTELFPPDILGTGCGVIATLSLVGCFCGPLLSGLIINIIGSVTGYWIYNVGALVLVAIMSIAFLPKTGGRKYGNPYVKDDLSETPETSG